MLVVLEKQKMLKEGDKNLSKMAYFSKPLPVVPNFAQIAKSDVHSGQLFVITHPKLKCNWIMYIPKYILWKTGTSWLKVLHTLYTYQDLTESLQDPQKFPH